MKLGSLLIIFFCSLFASSSSIKYSVNDADKYEYGLMLDAGSSGTRIHIYLWDKELNKANFSRPNVEQAPVGEIPWSFKIEPGISSFADNPSEAGAYLAPLIEYAKNKLPTSVHSSTILYLKATAGMRLLPASQQEVILENVRDYLESTPFYFERRWASVISGADEGVFGWMTVNFLMNYLNSSDTTVGALDLGGASTQISFFPPQKPLANGYDIRFRDGSGFDVYTHSFLDFGIDQARLDLETGLALSSSSDLVENPCFPIGYNTSLMANGITYTLLGTSNFTACFDKVGEIINTSVPCTVANCSFNGVYQPPLPPKMKFYAFSAFFYAYNFFGLDSTSSLAKLLKKTTEYCLLNWNEIQVQYPNVSVHYLPTYCFLGSYMTTLLHKGYGFGLDDHVLVVQEAIGYVELGWTLGAMLHEADLVPWFEHCDLFTDCQSCIVNSECGWCFSARSCKLVDRSSSCSSQDFLIGHCKDEKGSLILLGCILGSIFGLVLVVAVIMIWKSKKHSRKGFMPLN